ncbi:MAG: L,D-transpeptidase [Chitinophagaceae bacterium]
MNRFNLFFCVSFFLFIFCACNNTDKNNKNIQPGRPVINRIKPGKDISYIKVFKKQWSPDSIPKNEWPILFAVNRADSANLLKMDSIILPSDASADLAYYLPFPFSAPSLKNIKKIIFFSYPAQAFGAYEYGELVYTGPTNMGRKADPTPTGLFFTNWKAEKTTSTFNDEWELKWNFNIENQEGVGWHEYVMPGYPASHSCLRLLEKDARYLYNWADEWELQSKDSVKAKGTPVIVFGEYPFDGQKPWWQLIGDPHTLAISENQVEELAKPYINEIMKEQENRKE